MVDNVLGETLFAYKYTRKPNRICSQIYYIQYYIQYCIQYYIQAKV